MKKTPWVVGLVIILAVVINVSFNKTSVDVSKESIKIGGIFALTGPVAAVGELQRQGAQMAVDEANADGGIKGSPVELILEDGAYDSKQSVSAYQALKLRGVRYITADGSPTVVPVRKLAVDDGNFLIAPVATTPPLILMAVHRHVV